MDSFVAWLDAPMRYWVATWIILGATLAVTFAPSFLPHVQKIPVRLKGALLHPGTFLAFAAFLLLVFRLPAILFPFSLNADEPQGLAQALTVCEDPVFYRAVQSGSAGPLWTYPIMLPGIFGLEINYATGRLTGIGLVWITCVALYFSLRLCATELTARFGTLAAVLCFAIATKADFLHYSSEHPALPLVAVASFLVLRFRLGTVQSPLRDFYLLGLFLGGVPFAKLVVTIVALLITAFAFFVIVYDRTIDRQAKWRRAAALTAGGITLPAVFLSLAAWSGFGYFWQTYIANNYSYKQVGEPFHEIVDYYLGFPLVRQPGYEVFLVAVFAFILIRLVWWAVDRRNWNDRPWFAFIFSALVFAVSWYAVIAPGRGFPHYLLLTIMPMSLFAGVLASDSRAATADGKTVAPPKSLLARIPWGATLGIFVVLLPMCVFTLRPLFPREETKYYTLDKTIGHLGELRKRPPPPAAQILRKIKKPGDRLTVWGWRADYHVETQLPMGTRSACPEFQIRDVPLRDYYRRTALEEFKRNQPTFFLDAAGPFSINFDDRKKFGHHIFPELADYVRQNYKLAGDYQDALIFIRNDRVRELEAQKN